LISFTNGQPHGIGGSLQEVLAQIVEFAASVVNCDSCFLYALEDGESDPSRIEKCASRRCRPA